MAENQIQVSSLIFSWPGQDTRLFNGISFIVGEGWSALSGANGAGKSTLLFLLTGLIRPDSGKITVPREHCLCRQEADRPPPEAMEFFYSFDEHSGEIMRRLGIEFEWLFRWETLSYGERKKVQLGTALYNSPAFLALDEPTNHLDEESRNQLLDALLNYRGTGIVVSHDRAFLDRLCRRTIFLRNGKAVVRPGGLSQGLREAGREALEAERVLETMTARADALKKEAERRRQNAASQQKRRSKAGLDPKDHDGRFRKNLIRISGKDGTGGKLLRQLDGRTAENEVLRKAALERFSELRERRKTGISMDSNPGKGDRLLFIQEGHLVLGEMTLHYPDLVVRPGQRIALKGKNGCGKSSLLRHLRENHLEQDSEESFPFFFRNAAVLPQEISEEVRRLLSIQLSVLSSSELGELLSSVHRLGSSPEALLQSSVLSPGEARKLIIARASMKDCSLLILDEPTNHLDLDSIILLQEALEHFSGALLLVSHDAEFRRSLAQRQWNIECDGAGSYMLTESL